MVAAVNLLTFAWLGAWAVWAGISLSEGKRNAIFFVIVVHFFLCGVPPLLDVLIGPPEYGRFIGFQEASEDETTSLIYAGYVAACVLIWGLTGKAREVGKTSWIETHLNNPNARLLCYIALTLPLIAAFWHGSPITFSRYAALLGAAPQDARNAGLISPLMTMFCQAAVVAGSLLLLSPKRENTPVVIAGLLIAAWLIGKRFILALELLLIVYVGWRKGYWQGRRLLIAGVVSLVILGTFSWWYQKELRNFGRESRSFAERYENVRIDYGRDDVIKLALYSELHPENGRILDYRGQSMLYYGVMFFPRQIWEDKPLSYASYLTCRLLGVAPQNLGWGMTTSILEEAIANFGWFGLLIGPLTISGVCRIGDSCRDEAVQAVTILTSCLLISVHLGAFAIIALMWAVLVTATKIRTSRPFSDCQISTRVRPATREQTCPRKSRGAIGGVPPRRLKSVLERRAQ